MRFFTVADYVAEARQMLQDEVGPPFRYDDNSLVTALNAAMYEISRVRPDILVDAKYRTRLKRVRLLDDNIPEVFTPGGFSEIVPIPPPYKMAVVFYVSGYPQLRDTQDTTDARAAGFMGMFTKAMLSIT